MNDTPKNTDTSVELINALELASQLNRDIDVLHQAMMKIWPLANFDIKMIIGNAMLSTGVPVMTNINCDEIMIANPDDYDSMILEDTFKPEKPTEAAIRVNKTHKKLLNDILNKKPS